jgi:ribosomal protein S18 acetylase RimI-like enzyme
MRGDVELRTDHAGEAELVEHLTRCNADFVPPRSDIPAYVRGLLLRALRFEAWSDGALVGLVAAYANSGRTAFVTNVSVLKERTREGIATRLLKLCTDRVAADGIERLRLDSQIANLPAIRLYEKLGFAAVSTSDASITLELVLGRAT